jgi:predicted nucleotidyltransferase
MMKFGLHQDTVQRIQYIFASTAKVDEVVLFGSRAKGNYKPGSDIDLAIKGSGLVFDDILSLNVKLDSLDLPYKIDVVNYRTIKDQAVREHIDRVGITFYKKNITA